MFCVARDSLTPTCWRQVCLWCSFAEVLTGTLRVRRCIRIAASYSMCRRPARGILKRPRHIVLSWSLNNCDTPLEISTKRDNGSLYALPIAPSENMLQPQSQASINLPLLKVTNPIVWHHWYILSPRFCVTWGNPNHIF